MPNEKSAVDSFLGNLEETDKDPFAPQEDKDPFAEADGTSSEPEPEVKEEKPLPFNKDPKVQKFIEKEVSKKLSQYEVKADEPKRAEDQDDYYERLIGNDTPEKVAMIKEAKARDERLLSQAEERAFNRLTQEQQEAVRADQEAEEELEAGFEAVEETFDVDITSNSPTAKKTRQEFVTFIEKIAPKDANGDITDYPDIPAAWETFSEMKKATAQPSRAKELASRSMARSAEAVTPQAKPLNRTAFESTDRFLESLPKH